MADTLKSIGIFQPSQVSGTGGRGQTAHSQPGSERDTGRLDDARTRAALDRLGSFLASGAAPRPDAPRGTYLNITV